MPRREPGEPYSRTDVDEAAAMYKNGAVVIDVRHPEEYADGHVTGAVHIPVEDIAGRIGELPKDKKLLFICTIGFRSGLACEMAAAMGFDPEDLYNVVDGIPAWMQKGYAISYGSNP